MSDGMPDDWKDVVKKITDDWSDSLEDLMVKHSEAEFLKHAASTGVNFNLIQTEALKKLVLEDVGFVAQTNKKIGQSIIDDIEKLLITKGDWASAKDAVLEHVDNVFSGQEKIVIDNIGKQAKRAVLDAELGHVVLKDFTVKRKWTGNVNAYSDMVAKSLSQKARTMGDLEGYRTTTGIIGWRRMSSLGGKTCELCASLHGRAYYFAGEGVDVLPSNDGLMFEPHPNGFCYQAPIYEEWTGLKNLNETQLDDHLERWKIDTKSPIKNLKRVPTDYGRVPLDVTDIPLMFETIHTDRRVMENQKFVKYKSKFRGYEESLSAEEYDALISYTSANYKAINGYLQTGKRTIPKVGGTPEDIDKWITHMDKLAKSQVLDEDKIFYRGIAQNVADDFVDNGIMQYKGYTSTSESFPVALDFSGIQNKYSKLKGRRDVLVIQAKEGQKFFDVGEGAYEQVFSRNTKFEINRVEEVDLLELMGGYGQMNIRLIYCEII